MKKSHIAIAFAVFALVVVLGSVYGVRAYDENKVISQNIEHADVVYQQCSAEVAALPSDVGGAVSSVAGVCNGYELPTQLCNVNAYELQLQTDLTIDDELTVSGEAIFEGLTSGSGANQLATSTGTTILTAAQLLANSYLEITVNTGTTATVELPATSTMTTLMPNVSDHREWVIHNATSSTMAMTITKGDGIDLIGVTTNDDVIDETEYSLLSCWRKPDTDLACLLTEWLHLD